MPFAERSLEPGPVVGDRGPGAVRRRPQPAQLRPLQYALAGGHDLVEQGRDLAGRLDLDRLPQPDLGDGRPAARGREERRCGLEPAGDGVEPLLERREVAGEQREERVADAVEGRRAALPDALDVDVEDVPAEVVDLEVALEARLGRQPGRVDRLDGREVGPVGGDLAEDGVALPVAQAMILGVDADERREVGVVADDPPEALLDEVVEALVERTAVRGGSRAWSGRALRASVGSTQSSRAAGPAAGRQCVPAAAAVVSRRAAATATRVVSMSAGLIP